MTPLNTYVPLVQADVECLAHFLDTLSRDDWQRPSAGELWEIRDVVGHLIWVAEFCTDTISRGLQGDTSLPEHRPPGDTAEIVPMSAYFAPHAIRRRQALGEQLLPTFRASYNALTDLLAGLRSQAWDTPCAFFPPQGPSPIRAFLLLIVQELTIHTWDIRSRFDTDVALSSALLPLLLDRILARSGLPDVVAGLLSHGMPPLVRYRWDVTGVSPRTYDVIVESGKVRLEPAADAPAEVTLRCDATTFALLMYKRLSLEPVIMKKRVTIEGNQELLKACDQWLKQP